MKIDTPKLSFLGATIFVYAGVFLGRLIALLRETSIAATHGLSVEADILVFSIFLSDLMVLTLATASLGKVVIADLKHIEPARRSSYFFSALCIAMALFSIIAFVFVLSAESIVHFSFPNMSPEQQVRTIDVISRSVWSFPFSGMAVVVVALLESERRFNISSWRPALFNILVVTAVLLSSDNLVLFSYLLPMSSVIVLLVLLYLAREQLELPQISGFSIKAEFLSRYSSAILISFLNAIPFMLPYLLAGKAGVGDLTAYNFAYRLLLFPIGMIALMFDVVLFPDLATAAANRQKGIPRDMMFALKSVIFISVIIAVAICFLAEIIVKMLFAYGQMDPESAHCMSRIFFGLVCGLCPFMWLVQRHCHQFSPIGPSGKQFRYLFGLLPQ